MSSMRVVNVSTKGPQFKPGPDQELWFFFCLELGLSYSKTFGAHFLPLKDVGLLALRGSCISREASQRRVVLLEMVG